MLMTDPKHQFPMTKTEPDPEIEALKGVVKELTAKIQLLVELLDQHGLLQNHRYEFPDGDVWKAQDIEPKSTT